jgi:prephenate dehydrogenase
MRIPTLAIVGVGLIGGSIALAARRRGFAARIVGVTRHPQALEQAVRDGMLDEAHTSLELAAAQADLMVFCTPVDCIAAQIVTAAAHCRPGTLLTDAGSTKAAIVRAIEGHLPQGVAFVGSHPLAGSEKQGPAHASAELFQGRLVIVTPTTTITDNALSQIHDFWAALGARVLRMDADEHDRALALTSHLPHLLSSALAGILAPQWHELTATGFRDATRLAAGHPALWSAIFRANSANLLAALDLFEERLRQIRETLVHDDRATLESLLEEGKKIRDKLAPQ